MIAWGSDGRLLSLGRLDERECANCGRVQPFQLSLTYKFFHLYWIFCSAPGFLDSGLTVFASTLPRPARRGRVAPGRGFDSRISPASTVRCMSA